MTMIRATGWEDHRTPELVRRGLEALVMRVQLARPNHHLLTPESYNQLFTMNGLTMIFLYASPVLTGFSNDLWPLLLGSRDWPFRG